MSKISAVRNEGWDNKPTKKSATANEQSKMFFGSWRSDGVRHVAKITIVFNSNVAQDVITLRAQAEIAVIT